MKKKTNKKEMYQLTNLLKAIFGIPPEAFKGYSVFKTRKGYYLTTQACMRNHFFRFAETAGLLFIRPNKHLKPTTNTLQLFGKFATKNIINLNKEQMEKFIRGEDLDLEPADVQEGYVIVKYDNFVVGCASYKKGHGLKNQIPKSRRARVFDVKRGTVEEGAEREAEEALE